MFPFLFHNNSGEVKFYFTSVLFVGQGVRNYALSFLLEKNIIELKYK